MADFKKKWLQRLVECSSAKYTAQLQQEVSTEKLWIRENTTESIKNTDFVLLYTTLKYLS